MRNTFVRFREPRLHFRKHFWVYHFWPSGFRFRLSECWAHIFSFGSLCLGSWGRPIACYTGFQRCRFLLFFAGVLRSTSSTSTGFLFPNSFGYFCWVYNFRNSFNFVILSVLFVCFYSQIIERLCTWNRWIWSWILAWMPRMSSSTRFNWFSVSLICLLCSFCSLWMISVNSFLILWLILFIQKVE